MWIPRSVICLTGAAHFQLALALRELFVANGEPTIGWMTVRIPSQSHVHMLVAMLLCNWVLNVRWAALLRRRLENGGA